jgi:hypothetical protein
MRCVSENNLMHRMHRGSVAIAYFFKGIRTAHELSGKGDVSSVSSPPSSFEVGE